jgi:hypothetical protein
MGTAHFFMARAVPEHGVMLRSILGFYPPALCQLTTTNVFKHCNVRVRQNCSWTKTAELDYDKRIISAWFKLILKNNFIG